jgi:16S rRNA (adenine1518-N6/adenine1519-N6)-dimethyltransferase
VSDPLAPERLAPPTPGQLRRLLGTEGLRPRKSLSQNFLTDAAVLDAIVDAAELRSGDRVVEVGPGLGVLTRRLLAAGASVLSVEMDPRLAAPPT